jgi:hypothetical protein
MAAAAAATNAMLARIHIHCSLLKVFFLGSAWWEDLLPGHDSPYTNTLARRMYIFVLRVPVPLYIAPYVLQWLQAEQ